MMSISPKNGKLLTIQIHSDCVLLREIVGGNSVSIARIQKAELRLDEMNRVLDYARDVNLSA